MNVALIVCSTPAFANFIRLHVMDSRVFKAIRSSLGGNRNIRSNLLKSLQNPNRPRTGRTDPPKEKPGAARNLNGYIGMSDTWLLNSGATVDIEANTNGPTTNGEGNDSMGILKTVDVAQGPVPPPS